MEPGGRMLYRDRKGGLGSECQAGRNPFLGVVRMGGFTVHQGGMLASKGMAQRGVRRTEVFCTYLHFVNKSRTLGEWSR